MASSSTTTVTSGANTKHGFGEHAKRYLGIDDEQDEETKG
jgi:hypothetical protein